MLKMKLQKEAIFEIALGTMLAFVGVQILGSIFGGRRGGVFNAEDAEDAEELDAALDELSLEELENLGERFRAKRAAKRQTRAKNKMVKIKRKKAQGKAAGQTDDDLYEDPEPEAEEGEEEEYFEQFEQADD